MTTAHSTGQPEPGTRLKCDHCGSDFVPRNRNGVQARFCSGACRDRFKNAQRLKGAALLKVQKPAIQRRGTRLKRTRDDLVAAEGLPPGCYPPGAMGLLGRRRSGLEIVPPAERPALLLEAARRLGLTEEGPTLKAARAARASEARR